MQLLILPGGRHDCEELRVEPGAARWIETEAMASFVSCSGTFLSEIVQLLEAAAFRCNYPALGGFIDGQTATGTASLGRRSIAVVVVFLGELHVLLVCEVEALFTASADAYEIFVSHFLGLEAQAVAIAVRDRTLDDRLELGGLDNVEVHRGGARPARKWGCEQECEW